MRSFSGTNKENVDIKSKEKVSKESLVNRHECAIYVLQAIQKSVNMSKPKLGMNKYSPSLQLLNGLK